MIYLNKKLCTVLCFALLASAGAANAETINRDVVRDVRGQVIHNTHGNCVRTQWSTDQESCNQAPAEPKKAALPHEQLTVYFNFNKADLTPAAKEKLTALTTELKSSCAINDVQIVGFADRIGDAAYNEKLSKKRAEAVKTFMVTNGYAKASIATTQWVGETQPTTKCPPKEATAKLINCLQNDRRVEIMVVYAPQ